MEWQLSTSVWTMTCWVALPPARPCLVDTMKQIETLVLKRQSDIWDGEHTSPGCTWDRSMHGRSIKIAQPTIIFSSSSRVCRRNAKRIIQEESIQVDPRGIGIEFYENGPEFLTGSIDLEKGFPILPSESEKIHEKPDHGFVYDHPILEINHSHQVGSSKKTSRRTKPTINGGLVYAGQSSCTIGGFLTVDREVFGLTVAHAFEIEQVAMAEGRGRNIRDLLTFSITIDRLTVNIVVPYETSQLTVHHRTSGQIGTLHRKRLLPQVLEPGCGDMDWALCAIDRKKMRQSNNVILPNGNILCPRNIAQEDPTDMAVIINTGSTGVVNGCIVGDYSLVALPGSKLFQRMWIVVLERHVGKSSSIQTSKPHS